eukprot:1141044-Rhodomonas_salina.1
MVSDLLAQRVTTCSKTHVVRQQNARCPSAKRTLSASAGVSTSRYPVAIACVILSAALPHVIYARYRARYPGCVCTSATVGAAVCCYAVCYGTRKPQFYPPRYRSPPHVIRSRYGFIPWRARPWTAATPRGSRTC